MTLVWIIVGIVAFCVLLIVLSNFPKFRFCGYFGTTPSRAKLEKVRKSLFTMASKYGIEAREDALSLLKRFRPDIYEDLEPQLYPPKY